MRSSVQPINARTAQRGFTLIEMMVVVVVLSVLAGVTSLSVSSSEVRKNRAFYEHLIDSLNYVRLLSAEQMQPMGLLMQADNQGQIQPTIVKLTNPYTHLEAESMIPINSADNSMQLSVMAQNTGTQTTPSWKAVDELELPTLPAEVTIEIVSLESSSSTGNAVDQSNLHSWFSGRDVPQVLWYGNGQASPARIEVRYQSRLVGEAIILMPDGKVSVGE